MAQSTLTKNNTEGHVRPKTSMGKRLDIQGLRAIAVLAVVLDHLFHWPSGGFVGVDVFFVISGFLITGLLIREHDRTGSISFTGFYRRRVKRILPAAMVVLVATTAAAYFLLSTGRAKDVAIDAVWASLFSANWRFASAGTDYFDSAASVSPLQHFWSLAVEEQFYFVWPWLMVLIFFIASRRKQGASTLGHKAVGITMALIVAGSFFWALQETATQPTWAYFSTFSRTWELGIGALLAVGSAILTRIPDALRPVLAWLGLVGIGASLFVVSAESAFPAPWAALPVLSTALVIAAGAGGDQRFLWPLTNRVSGYLGDISYSLYLWHFPLIIFLAVLMPEGVFYQVAVLVAAIGLAAASYHGVENPVRRSGWLEPVASRKQGRMGPNRGPSFSAQIAGMTALAVVTAVVVGMAVTRGDVNDATAAPLATTGATATAGAAVPATAKDRLSAGIVAAVQTGVWPTLKPSIDELGREHLVPEWSVDGCLGDEMNSQGPSVQNAERCVYGDPAAKKTAVVLGDSVSISYVSGIRAALEPQGYKVHVYTMMQCPSVDVSVLKNDKSEHPDCDPFRKWTWQKVQELKPDLAIMSNSTAARLSSGAEDDALLAEWAEGSKRTFAALSVAAGRVVVLNPPPGGQNLRDCATKLSSPGDCKTSPNGRYRDLVAAGQQAAAASPKGKVQFVDTLPWFCSAGNECPAFVGTTPVYADGGHLIARSGDRAGAGR